MSKPEDTLAQATDQTLKMETPKEPLVPDQWKGKTPDELVSILQEKDRFLGERNREIGDLRTEVGTLRVMMENLAQQQEARTQPTPTMEQPIEFDYQRPVDSVERIFEKKWQQREQDRQAQEQQRYVAQAQASFYEGKEAALRNNKRLYEGIEGEVEQMVFNAFKGGLINDYSLRNPKTWERAAQLLCLEKGNEYTSRLTTPAPKAVTPTATEIPGAGEMVTEESFELNSELRDLAKELKLTEKEAKENMAKEAEAMARGEHRGRR